MSIQSSYRPHNPGHDYYDQGVYHVTLVVGDRDPLLGLGYIIQLFKAACTSRWRKLTGYKESPSTAYRIRHGSREKRREIYSTLPRSHRPLFDDDYDDTICFPRSIDPSEHARHKAAMIHYVNDNPRRAIMMKQHPDFFQRMSEAGDEGSGYLVKLIVLFLFGLV